MRAIIFMCLFLDIPLIPTSMSGSSPFEGGLLTALSQDRLLGILNIE
jgi:hypothetical protein